MIASQETHEGEIVGVYDTYVHVKILLNEACQNCNSKKACMVFSSKERIIDIRCDNPSLFQIGECVTVHMATSMGLKAVLFAYVLPVILLIGSILAASRWIKQELITIAIGLGVVVTYYLLLFSLRKKINRTFSFSISKKI
jgi:positive regulator of sigma E activity